MMKKFALSLLGLALLASPALGQKIWEIDPAHSSIRFHVTHLVVSTVSGDFKEFSGKITSKNKTDFKGAQVETTIKVKSVDTGNLTRDKHLKEDDFFNADKFPEMKFVSTSFKALNEKEYLLKGNLTIRDVTKPVELKCVFNGIVTANNKTLAGFTGKTTLNRFDFGLKWSDTIDSGSLVVGEKVEVEINLQLNGKTKG